MLHEFLRDDSLEGGQDVLVGTRYNARRDGQNVYDASFRRAKVVSETYSELVLDDGGDAPVVLKKPDFSSFKVGPNGTQVLWSKPLPVGDDAAVMSLAQVALDSAGAMAMFHVTSVVDGKVFGRVVLDGPLKGAPNVGITYPDPEAMFQFEDGVYLSVGICEIDVSSRGKQTLTRNADYERSVGDVVPGTLIAARALSAHINDEGNPVFEAVNWERVGEFADAKAIHTFLPKDSAPAHSVGFRSVDNDGFIDESRFGSFHDVQNQLYLAQVSTQPDEALVLVYEDGTTSLIGSTGRLFYVWHEAADSLYDQAPGPGLWAFNNAKGWSHTSYEGEHDAGIEGDWIPATVEDVDKWGYDLASMDSELVEAVDDVEEPEEGITLRLIARAEAVDKVLHATLGPAV